MGVKMWVGGGIICGLEEKGNCGGMVSMNIQHFVEEI